MSRYLTEFVGTFFLVLTIGLTVISGSPMAPLAIGSALMVMVYMGGHISGAHYNPAVTLAAVMRGVLPGKEAVPYMVSQILGATLGAFAAMMLAGQTFAPAPGMDVSALHALVAEFLFTFALVLVILNVATDPATSGNSYYGLAIGFTVGAGAFAVGGISGGAFNPAVGIGPILMSTIHGGGGMSDLWLYLVGPFAGAVAAALAYGVQHPGDAEA